MEHIKLILADSSPVVISGFKKFFEGNPDVSIIGECSTLGELQATVAVTEGCVSIVDRQMLSLEEASQIASKSRLILSAMPEDIDDRRKALSVGARGLIGKHQSAQEIQEAVLAVGNGRIWIGKTTAEAILNEELLGARTRSLEGERINRLTARERQVVQMACQGLKCRGIALELHISEATVAHHLTSIYVKVGVTDRVGLIIYAYRHGLHAPEPQGPANDGNHIPYRFFGYGSEWRG